MTSDDVYWQTAQTHCTPKELEALDLTRRGYSTRLAALTLGISREAVKDRLARADRKIHNALNQPKETAA